MNLNNLYNLISSDWERLNIDNSKFKLYKSFTFRQNSVLLIRVAHYFYQKKLFKLSRCVQFTNFIINGIEVPPSLIIGKGLLIPHPNGIVLGAKKIGNNVTIFQQVTLGSKEVDLNFDISKRPVIESNVIIGSGAKIFGNIVISENVQIYSNSVITKNIPTNYICFGFNNLKIND